MLRKLTSVARHTSSQQCCKTPKRTIVVCKNVNRVKTRKYTLRSAKRWCSLESLGALNTSPHAKKNPIPLVDIPALGEKQPESHTEFADAHDQGDVEGADIDLPGEESFLDEVDQAEESDLLVGVEIAMPENKSRRPKASFDKNLSYTDEKHYDYDESVMKYTGVVSASLQSSDSQRRMLKADLYRAANEVIECYTQGKCYQVIEMWKANNCFEGQHIPYRAYDAALASLSRIIHDGIEKETQREYRKMAYGIVERVQEIGFSLGFGIINSIIKLESKLGHLTKMQKWKEFLEEGNNPSLETYLSFLRVYAKSSDSEGARAIWKEMTTKYLLKPNLQAHVSMILSLGRAKDPEWREYYGSCKELLDGEPAINRKRWRILHNAAMTAAIELRNFDEVLEIRSAMKDQGIFLDIMTFPKLLTAAELGSNWELAVETIDEASTRHDFSLNLFFWERAAEVLRIMAVTHEQIESATLCQVQCNEIIVAYRKLQLPPGTKKPPHWTLRELRSKQLRVRMHWKLASSKFVKLDVPVSDLVKQMASRDTKHTTYDDRTIDKILNDTLKATKTNSLASVNRRRTEKEPQAEFNAKEIFG